MTNSTVLGEKLEAVKAVKNDDIKIINMPVSIFLQEGENLHVWCLPDKEELVRRSLKWQLVVELPAFLDILRELQAQWQSDHNTQEKATKEWKKVAPEAYDLRNEINHHFNFAYNSHPDILERVKQIEKGSGHPDMIQDLKDQHALGTKYPAPLATIDFDMNLLETGNTISGKLADLLAVVNGERQINPESKLLRDKAYTLCKQSMDEIRRCGQYAFWRNPERAKGYASEYFRKANKKSRNKNTGDDADQ